MHQRTTCSCRSQKDHTQQNTQRVLLWHLFLEECAPFAHCIKGKTNALADHALSRLPFSEMQKEGNCIENPNDQCKNPDSAINDDDLLDCFVHSPDQAGIPFVLDHKTAADAQTRDAELQQLAQ
jgi:hypothetical protein